MLVLLRKIGQQVVLPEQGITIDVVDVGKSRVRLRISAPSEIAVHRREVWDRARGAGSAPPKSSDSEPVGPAADEPKSAAAPSPSLADLDERLAQWITMRTGGRISELSVERLDGRIVIRGSARSYYARQLAQAAVDEVLDACDHFLPCAVKYDIDVAQVYWRSVGRTQGLTKLRGAHERTP
jgi:carbon storage regulator CsrA